MIKLALQVPGGFDQINSPANAFPTGSTLGVVVSGFLNVAFYIAGFLMFFWLVWGIFQYIFAGGSKEGLASARKRIQWAIIGFVIVVLSFAVSQYAQGLFNGAPGYQNFNQLTPVGGP